MKSFCLLIVSMLFLFSCKEDKKEEHIPENHFRIRVESYFNNELLNLNQSYQIDNETKCKFERIAFFTSAISLENTEEKQAELLFVGKNDVLLDLKREVNELNDLNFNIGVSQELNHQDPAAFSNSNPLNISNVDGLHWGWNPGYIFIAVEGKADTTVNDNIDNYNQNFLFHVGSDQNLRAVHFTDLTVDKVNDTLNEVVLRLDMAQFFTGDGEPINVRTENSIHGGAQGGALAQKVIDNFNFALTHE